MRSTRYAIFWVLFIVIVTAYAWREPLNYVGTPVIVIIPIGFLLWLLHCERSRNKMLKRSPDLQFRKFKQSQHADSDLQAHADLVRMCLGDIATVERLIRYERSKHPGLGRAQATRAARDLLRHDKQR